VLVKTHEGVTRMAVSPTYEAARGPLESDGAGQRADPVGPLWHLFVVSGVISAAIGILVLAYPSPSLKLLGVFLGIDLLASGVLLIVRAVSTRGGDAAGAGGMLAGTVALIAGLLVIRNPGRTVVLLAIALAIFLIVIGAIELGNGLAASSGRWGKLAKGAVLVAAGTVIIAWPDISLTTLAVLAGISLILQGVGEVMEGLVVRSLSRAARDT
jgi:uncharacterized membrane protein HdeD (DUF308 family)